MATKKDAVKDEKLVEETATTTEETPAEQEPLAEAVEDTTDGGTTDDTAPTGQTAQVVGAITPGDLESGQMEQVNVCLECQWFGPTDKGVAWCPVCGGKTTTSFRYQVAQVKAADNARFTGESATPVKVPTDE